MEFIIQDPTNQFSPTFQEALLIASMDALYGGGIFAFVTQGGAELYLEDEVFMDFINRGGTYNLIVGIDEITDKSSIEKLINLKSSYRGLEIRAFFHNISNSLFHPKFCWFRNKTGGVLIVGSANLTIKALRRNWESFAFLNLNLDEINRIEKDWDNWCTRNSERLRQIAESEVLERAKQNILQRKKHSDITESPKTDLNLEIDEENSFQPHDQDAWLIYPGNKALIAEIPRGGTRWNQANFDKHSFTDFFGAEPGNNSHRILLRSVSSDGIMHNIEIRPSVSVKSMNYRFELEAAAGLDYPKEGRPIGLFVRLSTRMFVYTLIMPEHLYYKETSKFLINNWGDSSDNSMRRIQVSVEDISQAVPNLPIWKYLAN